MIKNWLFKRRIRRIEKDALVFLWAFSEAKSIVALYTATHGTLEQAYKMRKRARSKRASNQWDEEACHLSSRLAELETRAQGVNLLGSNAVLEVTLTLLQNFYETHKNSIFGQYS